jgi:hypothetical protein
LHVFDFEVHIRLDSLEKGTADVFLLEGINSEGMPLCLLVFQPLPTCAQEKPDQEQLLLRGKKLQMESLNMEGLRSR